MSYAPDDDAFPRTLYGSTASETDPATGYVHVHASYADASGAYQRTFDEERGPALDHRYQSVSSYAAGVYTTDTLDVVTPLDGGYASSGTRYSSSYDISDGTATTTAVTFSPGVSYTAFHSVDEAAGISVSSYDTRWFYAAGGFYEYTRSSYDGPGGYTVTAGGAYHGADEG